MDSLSGYETELVFFDDGSTDDSAKIIEQLCQADSRCKAVFLEKNYGYNATMFYSMQQAKGDAAILLHADLQNPPELIPDLIREWECGHDVVYGVKNKSREKKLMFMMRTLFYRIMNLVFGLKLIAHATDFVLADKRQIECLRQNEQAEPILRVVLKDNALQLKTLQYTQDKRAAGKSNFTISKYYELTISWIIAASKVLPRRFLCLGIICFLTAVIELFCFFLPHIRQWSYLTVSSPLILRLVVILFSVMICFFSIIAEYIVKAVACFEPKSKVKEKKRIRY